MKILLKLYANHNLGDDLFLKLLLERYPHIKFYLPAPDYYKVSFGDYQNLEIITDFYGVKFGVIKRILNHFERKYFLKSYVKKLEKRFSKGFNWEGVKFDAFISIGGSIFMQKNIYPVYSSVLYYKLAQKICKNTFFLGCNFGPYTDPLFLNDYRDIFSKSIDVCFREKVSKDLFLDLPNVRCKPDIVFGLNYLKDIKKNNSVGFSIITPRKNIDPELYVKKLVELIELYLTNNFEIFLFSFCEYQGDGKIIQTVIDSLSDKNRVNKIIYDGDIDSFLKVYSTMEQMYCGRFHSMILSMIYGQKIFPIIYSKKMVNVLNDINYVGEIIDMEKFEEIETEKLYKQINNNFYDVNDSIYHSQEQFEKLDNFCNKEHI